MNDREPFEDSFLSRIPRIVFESTGIPLVTLLKIVAVLLIAVVGIGWTILATDASQDGKASGIEGIDSSMRTSKEKFSEVATMPADFFEKRPIERIDILNAKIEIGEDLSAAGGKYAEQATDELVVLYGALCNLEELEDLDTEKTYRKLAELRQEALAAGNDDRVATTDFFRVTAVTNRLTRRAEQADFRFASDVVLSLNSKNLVGENEIYTLYDKAIKLHDNSVEQESTAIYLSLLADKLIDSPESGISTLGLQLKDYARYSRFYKETSLLSYGSRESKLQLYDELFTEIEKAPPQSPLTYRVVFQLLDRLVNKSDLQSASLLAKRLGKAASMVSPKIKAKVDQSITNIETRISMFGKTLDLSGSTFDESPLQLPNDKPTTLVFWRPSEEKSVSYVAGLASSERFDPWETNVLIVGSAQVTEQELEFAGEEMKKFKVLNNKTSQRMADSFGIDLVPYLISLDKDGKVIRLGQPAN